MRAEATPDTGSRVLIGADLVSVDRVASVLAAQPDLAREVFTARELRYAAARRRGNEHLAARFAAKEAVFKALGTGLSRGMRWRDVEVVNAANGAPRLLLAGRADVIAKRAGVWSAQISLSHAAGFALAFAALQCAAEGRPGLVALSQEGA